MESEAEVLVNKMESEAEVLVNMEMESEVLVHKTETESVVLVDKMETESDVVLVNKMESESQVLVNNMETESELVVSEYVRVVKEVSKGVGDGGDVAGDIACKDTVLASVMERETVITEEAVLPAMKDDQMEIEKCSLMLQALPTTTSSDGEGNGVGYVDGNGKAAAAEENSAPLSDLQATEIMVTQLCEEVGQAAPVVAKEHDGCDGDGDAPATDEKYRAPLVGASQAAELVIEPCKEVGQAALVKEQEGCNGNGNDDGGGDGKAPTAEENSAPLGASQATEIMATQLCEEAGQAALVVAKEQEVRNGDGNGAGDGKAPAMDDTSLPEFLPVPENYEPSWGDVPDDISAEPVLPQRPPKRPRVPPECVEVDDVVQTMRNILFNLTYEDDAHLSPEDEAKVRDLLEYHPHAEEKMGSGIDFIKIKRHSTYKDVRCFWVVRTDGTETDFSYHKCLKMKVAKENPSFVDRYDAIYRAPKRPRMV